MGEVIDARPERFLREVRECGTWVEACKAAGLTLDEVEQLCAENPKFDLAQVECQLEYIEEFAKKRVEHVIAEAERQIAESRSALDSYIAANRKAAMVAYRKRHTEES